MLGTIEQCTIKRDIYCSGIGLHTGKYINMRIEPARAGSGINFHRRPIDAEIPAALEYVIDSNRCTTLDWEGYRIFTPEHILAALYGMGIDNARIIIDGPEVPMMDGSCAGFVEAIRNVGIEKQGLPKRILRVREKLEFYNMIIEPYDGLKIDYHIKYDDPIIGEQQYFMEVTPERFADEIANARTFGHAHELNLLWEQGRARGASLDNVLVIDKGKIANPGGLRYRDEFARHKILDLIGDIALLRFNLRGYIRAYKAGHAMHHRFLQELMESGKFSYEYLDGGKYGY